MDIDGVFYCSRCMRIQESEGKCPHCGYDADLRTTDRITLDEGTLMNDRYQLGAVIGRGGFGITYAAWDETLGMPVAIKEYFPGDFVERDTEESDEVVPMERYKKEYAIGLSRFMRESQVLAMLHEIPGVVKVLDCFGENETYYIVMEYIRGIPLDEYVKAKKLSAQDTIELMRQGVDALMAAHRQGVLHRDICPNNIMVQEDGSVKLIDFGAAAQVRRQQEGKDRSIMLTEKYAAIEQYESDRSQGPWTDIYGLSATLYTVLAGENPPESLRRAAKDDIVPIDKRGLKLKKHQCRAIMGGLAVDPEKRIRSMEEFRSILYDLPMPEEILRQQRFMRRMYTLAGLIAIILAIAVVNFTWGLPLGSGLLFGLHSDGFHVKGKVGAAEEIMVPEKLLGIPVTDMDADVFEGDAYLRRVNIPGSVGEIDDMAFFGCSKLENVVLDEGIDVIGVYAFADCEKLNSVYLPDSVERISADAFENTGYGLTLWTGADTTGERFALENGIAWAEQGEFEYIVENGEVTIAGYMGEKTEITVPSYIDGMPVTAFSEENAEDIFPEGMNAVRLPEGLRVLPEGLLTGREELVAVTFGSGLQAIEYRALADTGITAIELPVGLKHIGEEAFYSAPIAGVELPEELETIGKKAFAHTNIREIIIPDSVTEVGNSVFFSCMNLEKAVLSEGLKSVPAGIFENCVALNDVVIPEGITTVGSFAFSKCGNLKYVYLPDDVKNIDAYAFQNCNGLSMIRIPETTVNIDASAFDGCRNSLVIVGENESAAHLMAEESGFEFENQGGYYKAVEISDDGVMTIIPGEEYVETAVLPSMHVNSVGLTVNVSSIADGSNLNAANVELPRYLDRIEPTAFANIDLVTVSAENIGYIGDGAFLGNDRFSQAVLPEDVEEIGNYAFSDCGSLRELLLPDSLEVIGESAFMFCGRVDDVNIPGSLSSLPNGVFGYTGIHDVIIPGNVTLCGAAFYNCHVLETARVEEGVRILRGTFYNCGALREVYLPESLQSVSQSTFAGCAGLEHVWVYGMDTDFNYEYPMNVNMIYFDNNDKVVSREEEIERIFMYSGVFQDCPGVTIHGYPGSTAETYAHEHGLNFEPIIGIDNGGKFGSFTENLGD